MLPASSIFWPTRCADLIRTAARGGAAATVAASAALLISGFEVRSSCFALPY
jgi:hypothetical protein